MLPYFLFLLPLVLASSAAEVVAPKRTETPADPVVRDTSPRAVPTAFFAVGDYTYVEHEGKELGNFPGDLNMFEFPGPSVSEVVTIRGYDSAVLGTCTVTGVPTVIAEFTSYGGTCYARGMSDGTQSDHGVDLICDPKPSGRLCK
ncbi:hypothetical protein M231_06107 [Tremella mesenterica]|uniref:Uncharacterized protein n=1 Tax=Tremella mesenterica TaxID=5217 RepID=A0A4Q1BEN0_TREME|nr:uncharacterized protein TREMEDRAFT_65082 [Tremella mesenterica DSM 1558]EIW66690.1 hypothetical protein TREMEDRAFT_65082 [Tremella mesenterica DSM 1558]RXK36644.1 hypothetical protein M231_06107 [Tremella mesenterica]